MKSTTNPLQLTVPAEVLDEYEHQSMQATTGKGVMVYFEQP